MDFHVRRILPIMSGDHQRRARRKDRKKSFRQRIARRAVCKTRFYAGQMGRPGLPEKSLSSALRKQIEDYAARLAALGAHVFLSDVNAKAP